MLRVQGLTQPHQLLQGVTSPAVLCYGLARLVPKTGRVGALGALLAGSLPASSAREGLTLP